MRNKNGITMVALIITIIIMLILASIAIKQISGDGIVKKADEAKLMVDYQLVKTDLGMYKLSKETLGIIADEVTDESLIGTVYKKVFIDDTKRELAVIVDFAEIDSKPTYGNGGKKILKEDNDKTTVKEASTLYELRDVYAVDLEDGTLYYINGDQIYTLDGEKVEVEENETITNKYAVETFSEAYKQKMKFITKWNVILGEEEGSETYSTVVLPRRTDSTYDATIYWGDGTSTIVQHKVNGITLTAEELKIALTHNYNLEDTNNGEVIIEISGIISTFYMGDSTTKLKLTGIEQWGNVGFITFSFNGCTNLVGMIPANDLVEFRSADACFSNTAIKGFEDGFNFSGGNYHQALMGCANLEIIPNTFIISEGKSTGNLRRLFMNCTSLKSLPESFIIPDDITSVEQMFSGCSSLESLPSNFTLPNSVTNIYGLFANCKALEKLPENFSIPEGVTNMSSVFYFSGIKELPKNFTVPSTVTSMSEMFRGCDKLESIPSDFTISSSVINVYRAFRDCKNLSGTITIMGNPTSYGECFRSTATSSGSTLTVKYTSDCTNINEILATGNSTYVKGVLIEDTPEEDETTGEVTNTIN